MNFTKIVKAGLISPCQELSNGGLEIVAALMIFWELTFRVRLLEVQSSGGSRFDETEPLKEDSNALFILRRPCTLVDFIFSLAPVIDG